MNRLKWLPIILLSAYLVSGLSSPLSVGYENAKWDKNILRVCFGDSRHYSLSALPAATEGDKDHFKGGERLMPYPTYLRSIVRSIITQEYTLARTGIKFAGWNSCSKTAEESDVILFLGKADFDTFKYTGYSSIGRNLTSKSDYSIPDLSKKPYIYLANPKSIDGASIWLDVMKPLSYFKGIAIHEFGHLVGLGHEQMRLAASNPDINCLRTMDSYPDLIEKQKDEKRDPYTTANSVYDTNSIMNYCYLDVLALTTGLHFTLDSTLSLDNPQVEEKGALPVNAISLLDPSIFSTKKISETRTRYQVRFGLSLGDIHNVRCQVGFYSPEEKEKKCQPQFNPLTDPDLLKLAPHYR